MTETMTLLYVPCPHEEEAKSLVEKLMGEKLIACGNLIHDGQSIFPWAGDISDEPECYLICKTMPHLTEAAMDFILAHHSYDLPCVITWEVCANAGYVAWVAKHVREAA